MACAAGARLRSKSGGGLTMTLAEALREIEPLVPTTENMAVPTGVVAAVVRVSVEVPDAGALGEKLHAAPLGNPVHDRVTGELKPPLPAIETVKTPALPAVTVSGEVGETLSAKSADPPTLRPAVTLCESGPLVPVTVKVVVLAGIRNVVLTLSVEVPGKAGLGVKLHEALLGRPLQIRFTDEVKPPVAPTLTV